MIAELDKLLKEREALSDSLHVVNEKINNLPLTFEQWVAHGEKNAFRSISDLPKDMRKVFDGLVEDGARYERYTLESLLETLDDIEEDNTGYSQSYDVEFVDSARKVLKDTNFGMVIYDW